MIAYNRTWLAHREILQDAEDALHQQCITVEEIETIKTQHPVGFYTLGTFPRLGLYLLTWLVAWCCVGLMLMLLFYSNVFGGVFITVAVLLIAALEYFIARKFHFKTGVDDALCHAAILFLVMGADDVFRLSVLQSGWTVFMVAFVFTIRYLNCVSAVATFLSAMFVFYTFLENTPLHVYTPLLLCSISLLVFGAFQRISKAPHYYEGLFTVIKVVALIFSHGVISYSLIFSNPVHHRSNFVLHCIELILCVLLPLGFILLGFKQRNKVLFRSGLVLILLTCYVFMSLSAFEQYGVWISLIGLAGIFFAWYLIKYFKNPYKGHIAFAEENEHYEYSKSVINVEQYPDIKNPPTGFGGGSFGGGGASGSF